MIEIDDLDGSGKVGVGEVPDPDSAVADHNPQTGPLPTSAPGFGIDVQSKLLGGFDGPSVGGGVRITNGSALVDRGLCEHTTEFAFSRTGALALDFADAALRFGGDNRHYCTIHEHIHFGNGLFGSHREDQLFGPIHLLPFSLFDVGSDRFGGSFDGLGRQVEPGKHPPSSPPRARW